MYKNDLYGEELDYAYKYHEKKRKERVKKLKAERKFIVYNRKAGLADDGGSLGDPNAIDKKTLIMLAKEKKQMAKLKER